MKKELPKQQVHKAWILLPLILCCLLAAPSLLAGTVRITKVTGTNINDPSYSSGDTLIISGNALATADWAKLKKLTTGFHLVLQTADVSIPDSAFYNCKGLLSVSSPTIMTIGELAFYDCQSLINISFTNAKTIGTHTFQSCPKLTTASFPNATEIGKGAFQHCRRLTITSFPKVTTIRERAFFGCEVLPSVSFPNAKTIEGGAFSDCFHLTTASFPAAKNIGDWAFSFAKNLACLTLGHTPPVFDGSNAFYNVSPPLLLIVPDSTAYTPIPAYYPPGSEAFNKNVPTGQGIVASGTPYDLTPNRIPTLPGGYYRWEKDGAAIPGATGTTWQATAPGLYTLKYFYGGGSVTLLSTYLATAPYDLYGVHNRYQDCENILQITFTQSTAARTIEVWSEGTGAGSLYDIESGEYFENTLLYRLAAGDSVLTIRYAVDEDVEDSSQATFAYRITPGGITERTDEFTLYAKPEIKLETYYPTTARFKGILEISIINGSYYIQRSLDDGQSWQYARDTITGEMLPFSESQIARFSRDTTILFRVPGGCSYDTLTVSNYNGSDPSITRQVTMPSVPDAISSVAYGAYFVFSGDNFTFTLTPTGSNAGKIPHVSTSRTKFPDSEGVVITDNNDGSYTVTILRIQEAITITVDFATGNGLVDADNRVWSYDGQLYITTTAGGTATVYSVMGSLVKTIPIPAGETVCTTLPGGIYIVQMNGETQKIIING